MKVSQELRTIAKIENEGLIAIVILTKADGRRGD